MRIGLSELIVIILFAIFLLNPDKIPIYAKKLQLFICKLKESSNEINEAIKPVTDIRDTVNDVVNDTISGKQKGGD